MIEVLNLFQGKQQHFKQGGSIIYPSAILIRFIIFLPSHTFIGHSNGITIMTMLRAKGRNMISSIQAKAQKSGLYFATSIGHVQIFIYFLNSLQKIAFYYFSKDYMTSWNSTLPYYAPGHLKKLFEPDRQ